MAYTPTNWQTGDTITAEKLNKLENGVASGGGSDTTVTITYNSGNDTYTADKTFAELVSAIENGGNIVAKVNTDDEALLVLRNYRYVATGAFAGIEFTHTSVGPFGVMNDKYTLNSNNEVVYSLATYPNE